MTKRNILLAVVSGCILALAMPAPGWFWAAWVGLAPLLFALRGVRPGAAALLGLISGCIYFGIILHWMLLFGKLPWALLTIVQGLWFALFALGAMTLVSRRSLFRYVWISAAWTVMQWLRALGPYGFPWGSFAHTQANVLPVIQLGALTGPWGIDFLICTLNVIAADTIAPAGRKRRWIAPAAAALLLAAIGGIYWAGPVFSPPGGSALKIATVQPSLTHAVNPPPQYVTHAFEVHRTMSLEAAKRGPALIVWPETALTTTVTDPGWGTLLARLAEQTRTSYLIGGYDAPDDAGEYRSYNAAHLYGPDGRKLGVYRKVRLVPYGEFVPLREKLPWLRNYGIRDVDVLPGKSHKPVQLPAAKIGVAICFESLFPGISRSAVREGAQALFVLTNDSWFGRTRAAEQHLMMARLRAVETRRYVVRAASTGISAVIEPDGRVRRKIGIFEKGIIVERIYLYRGATYYVRWGDWFAYLCALLTAWSVLTQFKPVGRRRRA